MYPKWWLQELIDLGTELDTVNEDGDTALMVASAKGNVEMVKLLHEAKADLNVCGRYGTALHRAVWNSHTEVLKVTWNDCIINGFCLCWFVWASKHTHPAHSFDYWPIICGCQHAIYLCYV